MRGSRIKKVNSRRDVRYNYKERFKTTSGAEIEPDFWLPPAENRPAVVIESKTFGVAGMSLANSRQRKAQEALWLLVQGCRDCPGSRDARIVIVTGEEKSLSEQVELLRAELGHEFQVASVDARDELRECVWLTTEKSPQNLLIYGDRVF